MINEKLIGLVILVASGVLVLWYGGSTVAFEGADCYEKRGGEIVSEWKGIPGNIPKNGETYNIVCFPRDAIGDQTD